MFRVLVDTNVLLDLVAPSRPRHGETVAAFRAALEGGRCELIAPVSSLKDVYYVFGRHYGSEPLAREMVSRLLAVIDVVDLPASAAPEALRSGEPDFEDGLVRAVAEMNGCAYLLTRDGPAFTGASFEKVDAAGLTALVS